MNTVLKFFEKQSGISNDFTYDFALERLCVPKEDNWRGITPSTYSSDYNPEPPIFSAKFSNCPNYKHILAIANEDGKIALHNTQKKNFDHDEKALEGQQCHFNAVFDLEWSPNEMVFVSASGDHTARLWKITETEIVNIRIFTGHTRSVKTTAFRKNDPSVFATGGRDGAILIWDTRATLNLGLPQRADNCIYSGHAGGPGTPISQRKRTARTPKLCPNATSSSITGLVFKDDNTLVSCGAGDGVIKIWDLRRNYSCYKREPLPKHSLPYAGTSTFKGFTNLLCDDAGNRLYANCMDNTIYSYNLSSSTATKPIQRYCGFRNSTFYIKSCLSPDGNYIISGSSDEKAYIWNLKNPQPLVSLNGHTVEVTCVAWSGSTDMPIVTCSDDARHKIWRIGPEKINDDEKNYYKGHAEYCKDYRQLTYQNNSISKFQSLDQTPRSLKRIVEQNEKTPNSVEKVLTKRSFREMIGEEGYLNEHSREHKRAHIETRGRRLFSPTSSAAASSSNAFNNFNDRQSNNLSVVIEEPPQKQLKLSPVLNHPNDSNQENSTMNPLNITSTLSHDSNIKISSSLSPLSERIDFNLKSPQKAATSQQSSLSSAVASSSILSSGIFSPTSNLPNYVLDGDAPHLKHMSPKRKHKGKMDWLTKIRKQKLMSKRTTTSSTITEKLLGTQTTNISTAATTINCDNDIANNNSVQDGNHTIIYDNFLSSPRLQSLRLSDASPKSNSNTKGILKRRTSHSNDSNLLQKTSISNRRNSETTILKFFSTISVQKSNNNNSNDLLITNSQYSTEKQQSTTTTITTNFEASTSAM